MQLKALHYFSVLSRSTSIRQAADQLHITPTALTRHLAQLEHEFGAPLLERSARGIRLTAAGELLAGQAGQTLRQLARVKSTIGDLRGLKTGHVTLCVSEGILEGILGPMLSQFSARFPGISMTLETASASDVTQALIEGSADIGVSFFMPRHDDIHRLTSLQLPHSVVMAPEAPLAAAPEITLEQLIEQPLVLPPAGYGLRQTLERLVGQRRLTLAPRFTTGSLSMQLTLACEGAALALLPTMATTRLCEAGHLVSIPFAEPDLQRARLDVCHAKYRPLGFAGQTCLDHLRRQLLTASD
ncbi:LysR family transcriptional regulator [Salinicola avicenniae]|uniref:LysR family transcriptional regulator n=1 Tax=Salinicola avicenniae TaxID=2916836 RepID=UPI0020735B6C|nr:MULTISPECIES: LysR family transcriptional regulator [unclassified Salinicola]